MKIKNLSIENFKCFHERVDLEFGKLTLLTGANSSGKSSIIYGVLGAIQSGGFPFLFSPNGKYVDMGDFGEMVHNHNKNEKIKVNLTLEDNNSLYSVETVWAEDESNSLPTLVELAIHSDYYTLLTRRENKRYIANLTYDPAKDPTGKSSEKLKELLSLFSGANEDAESKNKNTELSEKITSFLSDVSGTAYNVSRLELDNIFPFTINSTLPEKGMFRMKLIFDEILKLFNAYDEIINFISSFRLQPQRTYLEQSKSKHKINSFGEGYLDQIMIWEAKDKTKYNELIAVLRDFNIVNSIRSKRLGGGRYEISVRVKQNGPDTSLNDVGFGVSQFLPVIVADLQLPSQSTLYVAQPEIHLHPSVQSSFGDYLVKQIHTQSKNYVIETHSEYLLNRIRLAIVKKEIDKDEVKIYFTDNSGNETTLHKIEFNEKGQILNAPNNFFKTYMMDVMEIAIHAAG